MRGFKNPKDAATFFGWSYETYIQHEQGLRGISRAADKYAKAFRVSKAWLLTGEGTPEGAGQMRTVQIKGYVGAGAEIYMIDDHPTDQGIDEIEVPYTNLLDTAVGVRVRGDSMQPAYDDGDVIIYDRIHKDYRHFIGKEVVVSLKDGRIFLKVLKRTSDGQWYLHSHNMDPIFGVEIDWVAKPKLIILAD